MRIFIVVILCACLNLPTGSSSAFAQQKHPFIAFAADTQGPLWVQKIFHDTHNNLEATRLIFKDIDTIRPNAFFILGDVVSLGRSKNAWKNMDGYLKQTRLDSIPVYATLGNHEVLLGTWCGTQNFKARFPMYDPAGYTEVVDSVAVILLNSNFNKMNRSEIANQDAWYQKALQTLDEDPAIKFIIVGCHHSPFTNSRRAKPSAEVQQHIVPPFIASKKCVLFLSGHSHNFERFNMQGKYFLVIGGGGGLHQPLKSNNEKMHDLSEGYKPAFHYLEVRRDGNALQLISRRLRADLSGFEDGLVMRVN